MKPILFEVFGIKVYGYGFMITIGIIFALVLLNKRSRTRGYDEDKLWDMAIFTIISGVIGGKILYILTDFNYIKSNPIAIIKEFGSGFVIYGAIIGGVLGIVIYCRRKKWSILKTIDLVAPSVALAQGFGRIGCFLAGCCYGRETHLPIGVIFKESPFAPNHITLHPTQLYSSMFDFGLALFLLWYDKKERKNGKVFSMYVIIYSVGRFIVEFLRNDPRGTVGILSTSQFIAIFTLVIGLILFNINKIRRSSL
ncbi:prolipoprotein diacylglyceryl transferase [Clostridium brassicae]|uniref:Phosphatidylglycerol--prolipoprotein diacylglyceryl transferase n=1 Tax=Clostridium brassicae TaxID=2999072 RepID=A0ABT4DC17_9CLOT|nr:prolipoprotein diacylglyceryl transferase [Clostridium brassicae]MCY6959208.1 prolipoprotein diacylglyceryl transferase [Clostridium brassicae]